MVFGFLKLNQRLREKKWGIFHDSRPTLSMCAKGSMSAPAEALAKFWRTSGKKAVFELSTPRSA